MSREVALPTWERGNLDLHHIGVSNCVTSHLGRVKLRCLVGSLAGTRHVCQARAIALELMYSKFHSKWFEYFDRHYFDYCTSTLRFNLLHCLAITDELLANEYADICACILLENEITRFRVLFGGVKYFHKGQKNCLRWKESRVQFVTVFEKFRNTVCSPFCKNW